MSEFGEVSVTAAFPATLKRDIELMSAGGVNNFQIGKRVTVIDIRDGNQVLVSVCTNHAEVIFVTELETLEMEPWTLVWLPDDLRLILNGYFEVRSLE